MGWVDSEMKGHEMRHETRHEGGKAEKRKHSKRLSVERGYSELRGNQLTLDDTVHASNKGSLNWGEPELVDDDLPLVDQLKTVGLSVS